MKFSIIIVSHNNYQYVKNCVDSVLRQEYSPIEILVVDNGSNEAVTAELRQLPGILFIENGQNLGFAKANAVGVSRATGECVVLLNQDTVIHEGFFEKASRFLTQHPEVDVIGPLVLSADGFPQPSFHYASYVVNILFPSKSLRQFHRVLLFGANQLEKKKYLMKWSRKFSFVSTHDIDGLSGVCMIIRRPLIDKIGLFDEEYFMYVEDVDFSLRARRSGAKIVFYPEISLTHFLEGLESKRSVTESMANKNLKYLFRKNFPWYVSAVASCVLNVKNLIRGLSNALQR